MTASSYVLIGEDLVPADRARIPVRDRGFLFGDAVYETLRTYDGCPFLLEDHLRRLRLSARSLYMDLPWTDHELSARLARLLEANRIGAGRIRITVTRGDGDVRARLDQIGPPRLVINADPLNVPAGIDAERGVKIEISRRTRNLPSALDPAIKSANLLNNLLARFEMKDADSYEVLLPNHRGEITEGSISNLFMVDEAGRLRTPALESGLLAGITRGLVLEIARAEGLQIRECSVGPEDLLGAREVFLTASTIEIMPVARLEDHAYPGEVPGSVTRRLQEGYRERVRRYCEDAGRG